MHISIFRDILVQVANLFYTQSYSWSCVARLSESYKRYGAYKRRGIKCFTPNYFQVCTVKWTNHEMKLIYIQILWGQRNLVDIIFFTSSYIASVHKTFVCVNLGLVKIYINKTQIEYTADVILTLPVWIAKHHFKKIIFAHVK